MKMELSSEESAQNPMWADSIAKILKTKPKKRKVVTLSKAKKCGDTKKEEHIATGFQVETADGQVKEEVVENKHQNEETRSRKIKANLSLRTKPNVLEKDKERKLTKIATRGVVQLFNVVKMQQKDIERKLSEAGPLEVKKDKVLKSIDKRGFLDVLMGNTSKKSLPSKKDENTQSNQGWKVLDEDFMADCKLKDWEKKSEEQIESDMDL